MSDAIKTRGLSRRTVLKSGAAVSGAAALGFGFPSIIRSAQAKKFLKPIVAGLNGKADDPTVESISMIPKILREKYDVEVDIQVHPAGALGTDVSHLEAVQSGFIDITSHGSAWLAHSDAFAVADLPYVFSDWDMVMRFFKSDLHKQRAAKMESDIPVKVLPSVAGGGYRWLMNSERELRTPADVRGLKIRTVGSPIITSLLEAWNFNPTSMPFPETYTAIQQGVISGDHFQPIWCFKFNFYEVVKYATEVQAIFGFAVQVINANTWEAMGEDIQKPFMLAAQEAADIANAKDRGLEQFYKDENRKKGMEIYTPSSSELVQWRERGEGVWPSAGVDSSVLNAIRDLRVS